MMVKLLKHKSVSVGLSVLSSVGLVAGLAYATSIGDAVSVSGALTVTGASTFTGAVTANGAVTLGDAAADAITVNGAATFASTVGVTGLSSLTGGFISAASSTHTTGVFNVGSGSLGVATSSPAQEVGISGDVFQDSSATTTHFLSSTGTSRGGCIEMLRSDGTKVRLYIGASTTAQKTDTNFLVVQAGTCQAAN